jgi:hypothetical protein
LAAYFGGGCNVVDLDDEFESKLVEAITTAENAAESLGRATTAVAASTRLRNVRYGTVSVNSGESAQQGR